MMMAPARSRGGAGGAQAVAASTSRINAAAALMSPRLLEDRASGNQPAGTCPAAGQNRRLQRHGEER